MKASRFMIIGTVVFAMSFLSVPSIAAPVEKDGKKIFEQKCAACHGLDKATSKKKTEKEWLKTVQRMKDKGAAVNDEEVKSIVDYLTKSYGKK